MASLSKRLRKEYLFGKLHGFSLLEIYFKKCIGDNLILTKEDIIASANGIIEMVEDELDYYKSEYEDFKEKDPVLARDACLEYAFNLGIKNAMVEFKKDFRERKNEYSDPLKLDKVLETALTIVEENKLCYILEYNRILKGERKGCKKAVQ